MVYSRTFPSRSRLPSARVIGLSTMRQRLRDRSVSAVEQGSPAGEDASGSGLKAGQVADSGRGHKNLAAPAQVQPCTSSMICGNASRVKIRPAFYRARSIWCTHESDADRVGLDHQVGLGQHFSGIHRVADCRMVRSSMCLPGRAVCRGDTLDAGLDFARGHVYRNQYVLPAW